MTRHTAMGVDLPVREASTTPPAHAVPVWYQDGCFYVALPRATLRFNVEEAGLRGLQGLLQNLAMGVDDIEAKAVALRTERMAKKKENFGPSNKVKIRRLPPKKKTTREVSLDKLFNDVDIDNLLETLPETSKK